MRNLTLFVALTSLATVLAAMNVAQAQLNTRIFVDPGTSNVSSIGSTFTVKVNVSQAENVNGWEVRLRFDPGLLVVSSYRYGDFMSRAGVSTLQVFDNKSTLGYIVIGEVGQSPDVANGNGSLAELDFKTLGGGRCDLHLFNTSLIDALSNQLSHTTTDGLFILNFIKLTPQSGVTAFAIQGFGFQNDSTMADVNWNGTPMVVAPAPLTTDSRGNFIAIAFVPDQSAAGNYTVLVRDGTGTSQTAIFTLNAAVGPQGPQGDQGPAGIQGPAGASGSAGPAGADAPMTYTWLSLILSVLAIVIAIYGFMRKK